MRKRLTFESVGAERGRVTINGSPRKHQKLEDRRFLLLGAGIQSRVREIPLAGRAVGSEEHQ